jgi:hypothetical protein
MPSNILTPGVSVTFPEINGWICLQRKIDYLQKRLVDCVEAGVGGGSDCVQLLLKPSLLLLVRAAPVTNYVRNLDLLLPA